MTYEPFIDDPEHLSALKGQRFVVLRPARVVRECYCNAQALLRQRLSALPASFPVRAHVTLAGFAAGTPLGAVQELVAEWIRDVPPLWIEVQRATSFPAPFQIAILEVRKTPALLMALQGLRRAAEERGLTSSTVTPPEQWVFHMSLAYCSKFTAAEWGGVAQFLEKLDVPPASSAPESTEIVAFDEGREYSGGVHTLTQNA
jgi:2'-5' RNA ligase